MALITAACIVTLAAVGIAIIFVYSKKDKRENRTATKKSNPTGTNGPTSGSSQTSATSNPVSQDGQSVPFGSPQPTKVVPVGGNSGQRAAPGNTPSITMPPFRSKTLTVEEVYEQNINFRDYFSNNFIIFPDKENIKFTSNLQPDQRNHKDIMKLYKETRTKNIPTAKKIQEAYRDVMIRILKTTPGRIQTWRLNLFRVNTVDLKVAIMEELRIIVDDLESMIKKAVEHINKFQMLYAVIVDNNINTINNLYALKKRRMGEPNVIDGDIQKLTNDDEAKLLKNTLTSTITTYFIDALYKDFKELKSMAKRWEEKEFENCEEKKILLWMNDLDTLTGEMYITCQAASMNLS